MNEHRVTRRSFLAGTAAAAAAPYVITSAALGNADKPPASERVTLGHIGVGGQGGGLFCQFQNCKGCQSVAVADAYKDRREARAADVQGQGLRRFPRAAGPQRHRRRGRRHARPLARADRHRRRPGEEGRLRREAAGPEHRAGPGLPQGLSGAQARSSSTARSSAARPTAASAASWSAAAGSARSTRSRSSPPTAARADRPRKSPSRRTSTTRCGAAPRP